jgi:hypothetical protein
MGFFAFNAWEDLPLRLRKMFLQGRGKCSCKAEEGVLLMLEQGRSKPCFMISALLRVFIRFIRVSMLM